MSENIINNPHDKFFKVIFSKKEAAQELIKLSLGPDLLAHIQLDTLALQNGSFVDDKLQEYFSDLVFSCKRTDDQDLLISFIMEHKSYVPAFPHIQIGQYLFEGYNQQIDKRSQKRLHEIIPIILYHGKKPWNHKHFNEYFGTSDSPFSPYLPSFRYGLVNLAKLSDENIKKVQVGFVAASLLVLKHRLEREFFTQRSQEAFFLFRSSTKEEQVTKILLLYIAQLFNFEEEEMINIMEKMPKDLLNEAKTTYERLIIKGKIEGKIEGDKVGMLKSSIMTVFRLLMQFPEMTIQQISSISNLEEAIVKQLISDVYQAPKDKAFHTLQHLFTPFGGIEEEELQKMIRLAKQ